MKVSVIMLTHNRLALTKQCLYNLLNNSEIDYELVLIDDYSTDNTRNYLEEHSDEIDKLILTKEHMGIPKCINIGIKESSGNIIIDYIPNDSIVPPGWLPRLLDAKRNVPSNYIISPLMTMFEVINDKFYEKIKTQLMTYHNFRNSSMIKLWSDLKYLRTVVKNNINKEYINKVAKISDGHIYLPTLALACNSMPLNRKIYKKVGMRKEVTMYGRNDAEFLSRLKKHGYKPHMLLSLKTINCTTLDDVMYPIYRKWKTDIHNTTGQLWIDEVRKNENV